uniref:Cytochrome c oxidase subunit 11 n=1 Tax=Eukaryota sp. BB2 TaxID=1949062 RepID=A0A1X8VEX7_9EUKA|nr:cytochrome c oxidase subunit 11 [Eukaryota sp. BB2]AQL10453.1 cytochrome c oxidase subunit 11 [Eukaryota sp. BB2]
MELHFAGSFYHLHPILHFALYWENQDFCNVNSILQNSCFSFLITLVSNNYQQFLRPSSESPLLGNSKLGIVEFYTHLSSKLPLLFKALQEQVYINFNETTLVFFRIYNANEVPVTGVTTYTIYPYLASIFFNKIQCFCFEELYIKAYESIDLPILFYIDEGLLKNSVSFHITLLYNFFETS